MTYFLGLAGKKGSGKDTAASGLAVRLNKEGIATSITHFADPLKEICHILFGVSKDLLWGTDEDKSKLTSLKWGDLVEDAAFDFYANETQRALLSTFDDHNYKDQFLTVRELLQFIGTNVFRNKVKSDIWASTPFVRDWKSQQLVIIADVRFPNEIEKIYKNSGIVLNIRRDTGNELSHESERALDKYPFEEYNVYYNNGSIIDLHNWVYDKTKLSFPELF